MPWPLEETRAELAAAREQITELEARLKQTSRKLIEAAVRRGTCHAAAAAVAVAAEEERPQAGRARRA
jgi:hypothetical protein